MMSKCTMPIHHACANYGTNINLGKFDFAFAKHFYKRNLCEIQLHDVYCVIADMHPMSDSDISPLLVEYMPQLLMGCLCSRVDSYVQHMIECMAHVFAITVTLIFSSSDNLTHP